MSNSRYEMAQTENSFNSGAGTDVIFLTFWHFIYFFQTNEKQTENSFNSGAGTAALRCYISATCNIIVSTDVFRRSSTVVIL